MWIALVIYWAILFPALQILKTRQCITLLLKIRHCGGATAKVLVLVIGLADIGCQISGKILKKNLIWSQLESIHYTLGNESFSES